jgi:hypothetical protein
MSRDKLESLILQGKNIEDVVNESIKKGVEFNIIKTTSNKDMIKCYEYLQEHIFLIQYHADKMAEAISEQCMAVSEEECLIADSLIFNAHEDYLIYKEDKETF